MKRVIIFGTGSTGKRIYEEVKEIEQVIGFLDNDQSKWGGYFADCQFLGMLRMYWQLAMTGF